MSIIATSRNTRSESNCSSCARTNANGLPTPQRKNGKPAQGNEDEKDDVHEAEMEHRFDMEADRRAKEDSGLDDE
jgi:hypothetical protein